MRRAEKEIHSRALMDQILGQAEVCRLALCKDDQPYLVPVSFGYDGACLYFHTAAEGMKLEFLAANNRVCFEVEHGVKVVPNEANPCAWTFAYLSVIGFGRAEEVTDRAGKVEGLNLIMRHYSGRAWSLEAQSLEKVRVWRIDIERITGKRSGDATL
jgi:nitroimidazol reductase NimA-like FMN-containing flavoprotein (pyridoxamine 5'-phosphate oxidase superfamily)